MIFSKTQPRKRNLNKFLAQKLTTFTYPEGRQLFVTCEGNVLSNTAAKMDDSDHEEADSRMMLHVQHALIQGMNRIKILTIDTVVIIIAFGVYHILRSKYVFNDIVVEFGLKKKHQTISLKAVAESLGEPRCKALPFFHSFTGSDTTSAFKGIGKIKAYEALKVHRNVESTLADFHFNPFQDLSEDDPKFKVIQRLVVLMYSKTSTLLLVNEARLDLYFQGAKNSESIPPTSNALLFHTKRAIFQSGVWSRCLLSKQNLPSPQNYGWKQSDDPLIKWEPLWMTTKEATKECREYIKCSCTQPCTRCKCKAALFRCTLLCSCKCEDKVSYD